VKAEAVSAMGFSVSLLGIRNALIINGALAILAQAFTVDMGRTILSVEFDAPSIDRDSMSH
jgi:hypothetical protein